MPIKAQVKARIEAYKRHLQQYRQSLVSLSSTKFKTLPATVLLNSSQINRFGVVLQSDAPNPCRTVTQPPVTEPSDTSPT